MIIAYTVTDSNYLGLTKNLVSSIKRAEPSIEKIVIGSMGLSDSEKAQLLRLYSKVDIIEFEPLGESLTLHDINWIRRTQQKTRGLLELLESGHRVFMLDSDCVVFRPFVQALRCVSSVGVCRRSWPALRKDLRLDHIASFFVGEGKAACAFVRFWIDIQQQLIESSIPAPYETPALCRAVRLSETLDFVDLDENIFSKQNEFDKRTRIAHLKSKSIENTNDLLNSRLAALSDVDRKIIAGAV